MTVADRIKDEMRKRRISQNRLAKSAQISQSGLSSILSGSVSPKENTLQAIASALGISLSVLIENGEKKEAPSVAGLREGLIDLLVDLSPEEEAKLRAFVAGMKANRKP